MRPTRRLLATPLNPLPTARTSTTKPSKPSNLNPPPPAPSNSPLLPAIPLYRHLLRLHRKILGPEERIFGDTYLKAEFRRHRDVENPLHVVGFLTQWQQYGDTLAQGEKGWREKGLEEGFLDRLSDEQVGQMWELREAIWKRGVGEDEEGASGLSDRSAGFEEMGKGRKE